MRYILATDGTWGDVLPFMFIAQELISRGHEVVVVSNEYYAPYAEKHSIPFRSSTSISDRDTFLANPLLWDPTKGMSVVASYTGIMFEKTYTVLEQELIHGADAIISHSFTYAAKAIAQKHHIKHTCVLISPIQLRSSYRLPVFYGGKDYNFMPYILKKIMYPLIDRFVLDPQFPKSINSSMREKDLPPITSFVHWTTYTDLTIGLWDEWYGPLEKDQQTKHIQLAGFPRAVEISTDIDPTLEAWITEVEALGNKPILVTLGSGYSFPEQLIDTLHTIAKDKHLFFIFVGPHKTAEENALSHFSLFITQHVPLSRILPRCEMLIHHGGAGMIAQSTYAEIPQIIIPQSHDQPDNAARIVDAGLGEVIWNRHPSAEEISAAITRMRNTTTTYPPKLRDGILEACRYIEAL